MSDIKELLEIYVATANSGKYKTFDEVNSKFPELKDYDKAILEEYVATANSGKYKTFDEVNSKFPEFFDVSVKKKAESGSSLDISAGPYASGQKPKGFGDIVSEKISEVSPQEEAKKASITDFGKKLESFAVKHPEMAAASSMEGLSEKKKAEELDTYGGSVKRVAAESFSKLLKAPAGGLAIIKSIVGDDKEVNDVEKFIQEIANVGHKVSDEIKKEDELISNYKETSITKLLSSGKFAEAGSRLGKGIAGSIAALPMYMNPATISATIASAASDTEHEAKLEGRAVKGSDVAADVAIASLEIITEKAFGTGSIIGKTFSKLNKSGADAALDSFRKSFQKDLAKTYGWELGGELSNTLGAYVINKARGKDQPPLSQQLSDTALQTLAMTSGFHVIGKLAEKKEKEQTKEGTPTISEEQQAQLSLSKPNRPELPPDAGGGGMPQAQSESQNQPLTQEENAVQIESTSSEVPPIRETGQIIPQGSEGVRQGEQGIETTQQGGQEEIGIISDAVNELQQNNVLLTINDIPVSIQVTNEGIVATDLETGDSVLVNSDDVLVDGQYPLTDVINEHIGQSEQQQQQQQAPPIELPKKIFHATKASFEGLPSRQEQSKVSAFGTEPAGTFYSTNPDRAKQAIGDGGDARVIEADFNPKNPLVIENTDNEVYSNIKNESQQQVIQELNDEYIESGVDLTTLEEGEIPERVRKRATEIFADKLKEQGYDAVINNENGDIIVLDNTVVTEKKAEPKAAPTNEIEKSQQIQELKDELNALDAQDDSKLSEKERKRIKNAIRYTVTSIARGYFLDGGKILWDSLKKETGFKGGEFKDFLGIVSKTGRTVNGIAQHLWETGDSDNFITRDYRDAIIEILNEPRDEWYVRQKNEVDADSNQNILEQKQKIQEQIDILEDADLSFEDIKNELEANEAMWQQKFEQEGVPKQKSGTFVNKELESDIPKALEYLAKMKELEDGTKKRNMQGKIDEITAKDPKLKKIIENFDTILKQLNYTSNC